ncbi:MAG: DUF6077 domain-containing protein [Lachnospiraceae bacterium]|nr:DUF6077 domain-containing protein [Lachnospiraceae bacterium]
MWIQALSVILWLVIIPFCLGLSATRWIRKEYQNITMIMVMGYFIMLAAFQVIYLPFVVFYNHFMPLVYVYGVSMAVLAVISLIHNGRYWISRNHECVMKRFGTKNQNNQNQKSKSRKTLTGNLSTGFLWLVVFGLIGFQIYKKIFYQFHDGDDAFYVVTSVITNTMKNMYLYLPFTGESSVLDKRHAFSAAPVFISFLSEVCGIHPTIMTQTIYSVFILIFVYMIYKLIGDLLLPKEYVPLFLIFVNLMNIFGNATIYTNSTFLLTRTGQGKAFLGNIIPAASILGLLLMWKNLQRNQNLDVYLKEIENPVIHANLKHEIMAPWVLLSFVMVTAVYTSLAGILLSALLIGGVTVVCAVTYKKLRLLLPCMISMIPLLCIGLLYLKILL